VEIEEGILDESPDEEEVTEEAETEEGKGVRYHDRIRTEADFAVEEVQKKDRYINELHEQMGKFKPLKQYVDAVGADELERLARIGSQIETNPQARQALQDILSGKPAQAPKQEEEEDEIYDPEIKALRSRYDNKLNEMYQIIRDQQSRLDKTETVSLKASLEDNMEQALKLFAGDTESLAGATEEISAAIQRLERAASNGDRSAAKQLNDLAGPQGARTLKMMTMEIYEKSVEKRLAAKNKPNGEVIRSKATDERSTTRSTLPVETVGIKSGVRVNSQVAKELLEKVTRKLGRDPNTLWG
jgi:hypothetical protein